MDDKVKTGSARKTQTSRKKPEPKPAPDLNISAEQIAVIAEVVKQTQQSTEKEQEKKRENVVSKASEALHQKQVEHRIYIDSVRNADEQDMVWYMIPKIYAPHVATMRIIHNSAPIYLHADGRRHKIHKNYVPLISKKLRHLDDKISSMQDTDDLANITEYTR